MLEIYLRDDLVLLVFDVLAWSEDLILFLFLGFEYLVSKSSRKFKNLDWLFWIISSKPKDQKIYT